MILFIQNLLILLFPLLIPWQFYFTVFGRVDLPVSFLVACAGIAASLFLKISWAEAFRDLKWLLLGYASMLTAIGISTLLRAPDNLYEAANVLGHLSVGLLVLMWTGFLIHAKHSAIPQKERIVTLFLLSNLPLSLAGIILFFRPELEAGWLTAIAGTLIEADAAGTVNNIQSINRVGVVFMDANGASVYWGFTLCLALWRQQTVAGWQRAAYLLLSVISCVNVLATGSRAGILALFITGLVITILILRQAHRQRATVLYVLLVFIAAAALPVVVFENNTTGIVGNAVVRIKQLASLTMTKADSNRIVLLKHSIAAIGNAPVLGHGVVPFEKLGFPSGYPPHNMFLQSWIYGGLTAISGLVLLFGAALFQVFRRLRYERDLLLPLAVLCWLLIQSMFLNFIIGDFRIAMLLWLIIALFLFSRRQGVYEDR